VGRGRFAGQLFGDIFWGFVTGFGGVKQGVFAWEGWGYWGLVFGM